MSNASDVFSQALDLPDSERADLANRLILSLEHTEPTDEPENAWALEISVRQELVRRGRYTASDWHDSVKRMRNSIRNRDTS